MAVKTYSFRYRPTTAPNGTEDRVLACSHTTDACHCVINSSGQIGYYVSGSFTQLGTKTQTIDNIWHSYIVEKDELGNGCIYVDGQKIGCATNFPIDNVNQIGNFKTELKPETGRKPKVGLKPRGVSNIYTRPCCGDIDEIAYFDRQLSASEIVDLAQSGSLSKVYTLADYKITAMADDNIIATTEKPRYAENWRSIWDADQRTTALPTAIGSITVNGSYKSLANAANSAGIWTPSTSGTAAYDYYQAVENWRQMYFVSSGGGTGFLLTAQLSVDTDISAMSPTFEARQSALMFAEDALRSSVMIKRQQIAEAVANLKTTLFQNIELAKASAKAGDAFMYSGNVYICNTALAATATRSTSKNWGNAPTAPVQTTQTVSGCVLTEPLVNGDTYFNTGNAKWYKYTGSWEVDTANGIAIVTYTPKYLGRYYQSHPDSPNNGDWWLVYGLASSPVTRGFWFNNNGTKTLVSTLGTEAQRKYKGSGLEDVLYASNNGYALTSGGVYDPVAVYGVSVMEFLAVNQAFINKLMVQELTLKSTGKIKSENFISGVSGFQLRASDGIAEFMNASMKGATLESCSIAGWQGLKVRDRRLTGYDYVPTMQTVCAGTIRASVSRVSGGYITFTRLDTSADNYKLFNCTVGSLDYSGVKFPLVKPIVAYGDASSVDNIIFAEFILKNAANGISYIVPVTYRVYNEDPYEIRLGWDIYTSIGGSFPTTFTGEMTLRFQQIK